MAVSYRSLQYQNQKSTAMKTKTKNSTNTTQETGKKTSAIPLETTTNKVEIPDYMSHWT